MPKVRLLTAEQLQDAIGVTAGTLAPAATLPTQLIALESKLTQRSAALEAAFPSWFATQAQVAKALPLWQSTWRDSGPRDREDNASPTMALPDVREGKEFRFEGDPSDRHAIWHEPSTPMRLVQLPCA